LLRLALNCDLPHLHFPSSWVFRHSLSCPGSFFQYEPWYYFWLPFSFSVHFFHILFNANLNNRSIGSHKITNSCKATCWYTALLFFCKFVREHENLSFVISFIVSKPKKMNGNYSVLIQPHWQRCVHRSWINKIQTNGWKLWGCLKGEGKKTRNIKYI
jgi:hypothetical protein